MLAWEKTLPLALVASAGLHLIAVLALDVPPPGGSPGVPQGLRLLLQREGPTAAREGSPATAPQAGVASADRYYRKAEVDVPAAPLSRGPLVIPERAYYSRLVGRVRARIFIGADGGVDRVDILAGGPAPQLFEQAALDALRSMRYQAAVLGGRAVKSQKVVEVVFNPRADDPDPAE